MEAAEEEEALQDQDHHHTEEEVEETTKEETAVEGKAATAPQKAEDHTAEQLVAEEVSVLILKKWKRIEENKLT